MTNAEARFNIALPPRKPEGSLGRTAQDGHLDTHTPELCITSLDIHQKINLNTAGFPKDGSHTTLFPQMDFLVTQNVSCFACSKGRHRERALLKVVTIHSNYAASFTPSRSHSFLSLQTTMPVLSLPHPPSFLYKLCRFFHSPTTTLLPFSTNIISINSFLSLQA